MHITPFFILRRSLFRALLRFPLPLFFMLCAVGLGIYIADLQPSGQTHEALIQTFLLGFLGFFALDLYAERKQFNFKQKVYAQIGVLFLLSLYFNSLPEELGESEYLYFVMWLVSFLALIWVAPHPTHKEWALSWLFHFQMCTRAGLSILYAAIFYVGVMLALFTGEALWKISLSEKIMLEMGIFIFGFLATWLFLTSIPTITITEHAPQKISCPIRIKTFTQFVLLPLLILYGSLLLLYIVIALFYPPHNWNAWLYVSLSYIVCVLLTHLFIYPLIFVERKWRVLIGFLYLSLLPLSIGLLIGGIERGNIYGWTENRLLVMIGLIWLLVWSIYNVWQRQKTQLLYWSLSWAFLLIFFSFGYWSIFNISTYSLTNHWGKIWLKNNALNKEGKLVFTKIIGKKINQKDLKQLASIILHLGKRKKLHQLQPYFETNLTQLLNQENDVTSQEELILQLIKLPQLYAIANLPAYQNEVNFSAGFMQTYENIQGYDHLLRFQYYDEKNKKMTYTIGDKKYELNIIFWENKLIFSDEKTKNIILSFEMAPIIKNLFTHYLKTPHKVPPASLRIIAKSNDYQALLQIENINVVKKTANEFHCHGIDGHIFLKF
jgi:hypothetical protein